MDPCGLSCPFFIMDVIVLTVAMMAAGLINTGKGKVQSLFLRHCRIKSVQYPIIRQGQEMRQDLICYCFGYTAEDIRADLAENGRSKIMTRIMREKKSGRCNCASTNPKGK